ncbi:MAG: 4-(cytidine 5'-diphospho)-2-C-methyl-D-erythritol kinase [Alphaproteobacteria bacterium]|nr:4-(cytidine 5'-diphospho)-2-C-methyl-D-erythritol kinase [Alphaproteobacteria bacterium]
MQNKSSARPLRYFAPAKINLYLHVTGQRPDGYHELDSVVIFAPIGDDIFILPADDLTLEIIGPEAHALQGFEASENLVFRAARMLAEKYKVTAGAAITLNKVLPVASGMGGGSADAAATLKALVEFWKLKPAAGELVELALALGADVPVCMKSRPLRMTGIGEKLHETPAMPNGCLVLVNPRISQSTPEVFEELHRGKWKASGYSSELPSDLDFYAFVSELKSRANDLEQPAIRLAPVIEDVLAVTSAQANCRLARMSGSGATCFGLFQKIEEAEAAATEIRRHQPEWWIQTAGSGDEGHDLRQAYTG